MPSHTVFFIVSDQLIHEPTLLSHVCPSDIDVFGFLLKTERVFHGKRNNPFFSNAAEGRSSPKLIRIIGMKCEYYLSIFGQQIIITNRIYHTPNDPKYVTMAHVPNHPTYLACYQSMIDLQQEASGMESGQPSPPLALVLVLVPGESVRPRTWDTGVECC